MNRVALAYSGVHQIFQLALAAHEIGELDGLFCSLVDGKDKWGERLGRLAPRGTIRPLGWESLPQSKLHEFPWPLLVNRLGKKYLPWHRTEHLWSNNQFDRAAARWLRQENARVFVGGETCALASLRQAGRMGMHRVLDCPGIPAQLLDMETQRAAEIFNVEVILSSNSARMRERKQEELAEADVVLCCSDFQRDHLVALNPGIRRTEVIPLWANADFWRGVPGTRDHFHSAGALRVLYAGSVSLRKGVPCLLEAVELLAREVSLTMVGEVSVEMKKVVGRYRSHRHLPYVSKERLKDLFYEHDLLVMPTLGDSFGFVMIEAMAAGLPVIASYNAGAPVPDESWRVPPHDAAAIRDKLLSYHADRDRLRHDGLTAENFAAGFRPERYRAKAAQLFNELLAK